MNNTDINPNITQMALDVMEAQRQAVARIGAFLGEQSPEYVKAVSTLYYALNNMWSLRPTAIRKDGELSLLCYNELSGLTFGVNFTETGPHKDRSEDEMEIINDMIKNNALTIGTWSVNS